LSFVDAAGVVVVVVSKGSLYILAIANGIVTVRCCVGGGVVGKCDIDVECVAVVSEEDAGRSFG